MKALVIDIGFLEKVQIWLFKKNNKVAKTPLLILLIFRHNIKGQFNKTIQMEYGTRVNFRNPGPTLTKSRVISIMANREAKLLNH